MANKIFIIEDDANLLAGLQAKFRVEGFSVITDFGFKSEDIFKKIIDLKPNYIILDLILPRIDGFQLLADLKGNQETASLPVFVFTNLSDEDSRSRCQNLGADYYLVKAEFPLDNFVAKVKKIIANRR